MLRLGWFGEGLVAPGLLRQRVYWARRANTTTSRPHLAPPPTLLTAHLHPFLEQHTSSLQSQLESTQQANTVLAADVRAQRAEIERLLSGLEGAAADISGAADALGREKALRDVEGELDGFAGLGGGRKEEG